MFWDACKVMAANRSRGSFQELRCLLQLLLPPRAAEEGVAAPAAVGVLVTDAEQARQQEQHLHPQAARVPLRLPRKVLQPAQVAGDVAAVPDVALHPQLLRRQFNSWTS